MLEKEVPSKVSIETLPHLWDEKRALLAAIQAQILVNPQHSIRYNLLTTVESLFNLFWLALSSVLLVLWLQGQRQWSDESLHPSRRMQFVAIAMLILILFPVISLSDDLQAYATSSETEHLARRGDLIDHNNLLLLIPAALSMMLLLGLAYRRSRTTVLTVTRSITPDHTGYRRILGNLPPPLAA